MNKEIRIEPDIVFEISSIVKHMHALSYFYVCDIDDQFKKNIHMQELIECQLSYDSKIDNMLKKYGLFNKCNNWSLDFETGILSYEQ